MEFTLNSKTVRYEGNPLTRLVDFLREDMNLTGTKEGCGEGECGACSVLRNGKLVTSCLIPMGALAGDDIVTIEGLRETEQGKCLISAFADAGAVQCGFCIPAMVMAAQALLLADSDPDEEAVRLAISGNICRCTGYDLIVDAILLAAKRGNGLW